MVLFTKDDLVAYRRFGNLTGENEHILLLGREGSPEQVPVHLERFAFDLNHGLGAGELIALSYLIIRIIGEECFVRRTPAAGKASGGSQVHPQVRI